MQYLFFFTTAILIVFGIGSILRIRVYPESVVSYVIPAIIMFADAALMAFCAWQLKRKTRFIYFFSISVLGLNALLSAFDQFGWLDALFLLLNLTTLIFLFLSRKEFLSA